MVMFYCSAQPSNIKPTYGAYDQVDWVIKPAMGRSVMSNSFRISGNIKVQKLLYGETEPVNVTPADQVFLDPFAGIHGIVKNVSSLVNERIIENVSSYARYVSQKTQATNTLESLTSSSASISGNFCRMPALSSTSFVQADMSVRTDAEANNNFDTICQ